MKIILFTSDISGLNLPIHEHDIAVILPTNRLLKEKVTKVKRWCLHHNVPWSWQISRKDAKYHESIGMDSYPNIYGDLGISWFYTMLFPHEILNRFPIINYHAGPPGPHALRKAIREKHRTIRCFWHWVDEGIDTGSVITEQVIDIPWNFAASRKLIINTGISMFPYEAQREYKRRII